VTARYYLKAQCTQYTGTFYFSVKIGFKECTVFFKYRTDTVNNQSKNLVSNSGTEIMFFIRHSQIKKLKNTGTENRIKVISDFCLLTV